MELKAKHFEHNTMAVSAEQYAQHLKLYNGYVSKINQITAELEKNPDTKDANATYSRYRSLKKGETYSLDGVILHELYFQNMCKQKKVPCTKTTEMLNNSFGGFEKWRVDFTACCQAARGWCVLAYEQRTNTYRNLLQDLHDDGVVCMAYPLLVMDMYEHAYFLDYGTNKDEYIKNFLSAVDWDVVEKRIDRLR
ncbi:MAG: Fe-Mn family superoxide dismutase [Defluviitaleaceae bacterium]|nr:Fe-Mn family superoxide dismutase [Defluviitaleaceae bacterium]